MTAFKICIILIAACIFLLMGVCVYLMCVSLSKYNAWLEEIEKMREQKEGEWFVDENE